MRTGYVVWFFIFNISCARNCTAVSLHLPAMTSSALPQRLEPLPIRTAAFIEPMEALSTGKLPDGPEWVWEIKLDGYRALAVKTESGVTLYSRRKESLNRQFPYIVEALADLPSGTVIDGEVVGLDENGRPDFNLLQNYRARHPASSTTFSIFYVSRITT